MSFISSFKYVSDKFKSNKHGKYTPINEQVNITASSSNSGSGNIEVENIREPVVSNIPFRIITSLTVSVISLLLLSLSTKNKDLVSPTAYFYFVIFLVGISGVTTGYLQNDTFGTAAQISPKYTQAVMSGQGLAGLGASISQIFSILNSCQVNRKSLPIIKFFAIKNIDLLMLMSTSRIIFIPLILLCNIDIGDKRLFPLLITNDFLYFFIIILFSFSNGYLASLIMMTGPQIQNVNKGLAGTLLTFCMVLGLTIGSLLSFPMRSLSCGGCNPFIN
ncbi:8258_t:CDS:2 [Entrophospora sp. SA101]|nr:8258_t:CDS:2 [Entrophospora sp. SA101]